MNIYDSPVGGGGGGGDANTSNGNNWIMNYYQSLLHDKHGWPKDKRQ